MHLPPPPDSSGLEWYLAHKKRPPPQDELGQEAAIKALLAAEADINIKDVVRVPQPSDLDQITFLNPHGFY